MSTETIRKIFFVLTLMSGPLLFSSRVMAKTDFWPAFPDKVGAVCVQRMVEVGINNVRPITVTVGTHPDLNPFGFTISGETAACYYIQPGKYKIKMKADVLGSDEATPISVNSELPVKIVAGQTKKFIICLTRVSDGSFTHILTDNKAQCF